MVDMPRVILTLLIHCNKAEKQSINVSFENTEVYNRPFCMEELQDALRMIHNPSAEYDETHFHLFKH